MSDKNHTYGSSYGKRTNGTLKLEQIGYNLIALTEIVMSLQVRGYDKQPEPAHFSGSKSKNHTWI